jgi:hypothetical protein
MMTAEEIVTLLRERSAKMASIGVVDKKQETDDQRKVRASAQSDFDVAAALARLIEEIEP